jgi:hypothetical protein
MSFLSKLSETTPDYEVVPSLVGAQVLPSLESDLRMTLRQGRDMDSNLESQGAFSPLPLPLVG